MPPMHIVQLRPGGGPQELPQIDELPSEGLLWLDFIRERSPDWQAQIERLGVPPIDPEHVIDSFSPQHPSYFDATSDYDLVIFEGMGPSDDPMPWETRRAVFFIFDRVIVTVRAGDSPSFAAMRSKLLSGRAKCPLDPVYLAQAIIDLMVDRFLNLREVLDRRMTELQEALLDSDNGMDDWRALLDGRRAARRLELLAENQLEALGSWQRNTRFDWSPAVTLRVHGLCEHVGRVMDHASNIERDVEAAVQLYFASVGHRTNRVMQVLTALSAIFFPLTLITGIYGMNFDHMPELHWRYGYYVVVGALPVIAIVMLLLFRRKGFLR